MPHVFTLPRESLMRKFAVYVVVAKSGSDTHLYVGKTDDNREGCNPMISRCGNHFSYNEIHSQIRNKISNHEERDYTYIFEHFDDYTEDDTARRVCIDNINEMERWLNEAIQKAIEGKKAVQLLNPFAGRCFLKKVEQEKRRAFRTENNSNKIFNLVEAVVKEIG